MPNGVNLPEFLMPDLLRVWAQHLHVSFNLVPDLKELQNIKD